MYAQATLEDTVGKIELIAFSSSYQKLAEKLKIEVPVLVRGCAARRRGLGAEALALEHPGAGRCADQAAGGAAHQGAAAQSRRSAAGEAAGGLPAAPGKGKLLLDLEEPGEFCAVLEPQGVDVSADRLFIDRVEELVGRGAVRVIG